MAKKIDWKKTDKDPDKKTKMSLEPEAIIKAYEDFINHVTTELQKMVDYLEPIVMKVEMMESLLAENIANIKIIKRILRDKNIYKDEEYWKEWGKYIAETIEEKQNKLIANKVLSGIVSSKQEQEDTDE